MFFYVDVAKGDSNILFDSMKVPEREKVVIAEKTSDRACTQARMERILGLSQRNHSAILSVRFSRESGC